MNHTTRLFNDAQNFVPGAMAIVDHVLEELVACGCCGTPKKLNAKQQAIFNQVKAEFEADPEGWTEGWAVMEDEAYL